MRAFRVRLVWLLVRFWASPYSLAGLSLGLILRGKLQVIDGVVEIHGPAVAAFLRRLPPRAIALTMGHTVLGATPWALDMTRSHERVHVRQFERWGPLMGPAYLLSSVYMVCRGRNYYRDNPFEAEAFADDQRRRDET